jgi:hypothetical protein
MTKQETEQCIKVLKMLEYIGCEPISEAFGKIHYWDFVVSLSEGYESYNSLSDKQYEALVKLISKHTTATCKPKGWNSLDHTSKYSRTCTQTTQVPKQRVEHDYEQLKSIQLYDLPYKDGEEIDLVVYPYNETHMVVKISGNNYKVPKPAKWENLTGETAVTCTYRRTEYKGYLEKKED